MKKYIKPKLEYVHLAAEENFAVAGSGCQKIYLGDSGLCPEYITTLNV